MCRLIEFPNVRQIPGEPRRRWFTCKDVELVVWCDQVGGPIGFQFCYKDGRSEFAFTWNPECGCSHKIIDDGELRPGKHKATPILVEDATASVTLICERFAQVKDGLPVEIAEFVSKKLEEGVKSFTKS